MLGTAIAELNLAVRLTIGLLNALEEPSVTPQVPPPPGN
jgi:hypothetical protein